MIFLFFCLQMDHSQCFLCMKVLLLFHLNEGVLSKLNDYKTSIKANMSFMKKLLSLNISTFHINRFLDTNLRLPCTQDGYITVTAHITS